MVIGRPRVRGINRNLVKGLCFGTFDPLHYGHIRLFRRAARYCDLLVAVTESDEVIRREKGREPYTDERSRLRDLGGIRYLDGVDMRTDTRESIVDKWKPDLLFVGEDHRDCWPEGEALGVTIMYLPRTEGIDSTLLRS